MDLPDPQQQVHKYNNSKSMKHGIGAQQTDACLGEMCSFTLEPDDENNCGRSFEELKAQRVLKAVSTGKTPVFTSHMHLAHVYMITSAQTRFDAVAVD